MYKGKCECMHVSILFMLGFVHPYEYVHYVCEKMCVHPYEYVYRKICVHVCFTSIYVSFCESFILTSMFIMYVKMNECVHIVCVKQ